jgi:diketogulonate reductase-like aldo/keto reductase
MTINRRDALRLIGTGVGGFAAAASMRAGSAGGSSPLPAVRTRPIPSSGEAMPVIGVGTWQTFDVGDSPSERAPLEAVLRELVSFGGRMVDSSPMYGRSEGVVGDLSAKPGLRARLFLATKVWTSGRAAGIRQMEESFRRFRTTTIDLLQVHNLVDVATHLPTLREWKAAGRIRYAGVTHYTTSGQDAVARIVATEPLDFIQINYSVGERDAEKRLLRLALDRKVAVIANRPFAGGDLFARLRARPLPSWAAEIDCTSWAQILLKFVVSHPAITCAIPGTGKVEHLRDNMKAALGRLPDEGLRARIAAEAV